MKEYIFELGDALYDEKTGKAVFNPKVKGELIRCKECKHYDKDTEICDLFTDEYTWQTDPSWYCADGERKES